jgi:AAA+ ATPase superfamily predicted ATPase
VADRSAGPIQRRYFAEVIAEHLPGFGDVDYPDWRKLLARLAQDALRVGFRGPVIFDEFPYLVGPTPEFPSVLQRWLDHDAKKAHLVVALAGSSQRMMQGLVLSRDAPLYGRAKEMLEIKHLEPSYLMQAFASLTSPQAANLYSALGGVPRYWELYEGENGGLATRLDRLVLDPLGPLHREADRLLLEETPPAIELRPLLDAIGTGAHRLSEIAGRIGCPGTSLSRPISRLVEMGLVRRETPFGESEARGKRSLYKIADSFLRLWFRVVAPYRAQLAIATPNERKEILARHWRSLAAQGWEDLCRICLHRLPFNGQGNAWTKPARWWRGNDPEWDLIACSVDGKHLLAGECKWSARKFSGRALKQAIKALTTKRLPLLTPSYQDCRIQRTLFVPAVNGEMTTRIEGVSIVTAHQLLGE